VYSSSTCLQVYRYRCTGVVQLHWYRYSKCVHVYRSSTEVQGCSGSTAIYGYSVGKYNGIIYSLRDVEYSMSGVSTQG